MWSAATSASPCSVNTHMLPLRLRDLSGRIPLRSHHHEIRSGITLPCVQMTGTVSPSLFAAIFSTRLRAASASAAYASSVSVGSSRTRTPSSCASGSTVWWHRVRDAAKTSLAPKASSWPTSDSACARPFLSSGRSRSSPLYRALRPAVACRTISTVRVSAGRRVNRRSTFRSWGYCSRSMASATGSQSSLSTSELGLNPPPVLRAAQ